ncbi:DUF2680 domain-containing protein [Desulfotomaculum copahuensis]|uniref:Fis family transcriptional regulator n=1 Tax=Desulfotomaculum copahuensis TaxID=1838280 RepID=A0A1B7LEG8_9FIRM|nr:DUF2680 domain-containing protein [Desulfotomaculum copahuensis]OAT81673.1 hypothetical protein A6M21_09675 [Desulfotomaculum copahuensis]
MFKINKKSIAVGIVTAALAVTAVAGSAFAQTAPATNAPKPGINLYQTFVSGLATNLGIDQSTLTAAMTKTEQQMIDNAVQQGAITQDQANKMEAYLQKHPGMLPFFGHRGPGRPGGKANLNLVAQALGMNVSDLQSQLHGGKKLADIVQAQGMSMQQFREKMLTLREQAIQQNVSSGKMTQQQADKILQRLQAMQQKLEGGGTDSNQ